MTIHHKGTSYFDSAAHFVLFTQFKRNDKLSWCDYCLYTV